MHATIVRHWAALTTTEFWWFRHWTENWIKIKFQKIKLPSDGRRLKELDLVIVAASARSSSSKRSNRFFIVLVGVAVRLEWPDSESVEPNLVTCLFLRLGPSVTSLDPEPPDWPRFDPPRPASEVGSNFGRKTGWEPLAVHSPELMRRFRWRLKKKLDFQKN